MAYKVPHVGPAPLLLAQVVEIPTNVTDLRPPSPGGATVWGAGMGGTVDSHSPTVIEATLALVLTAQDGLVAGSAIEVNTHHTTATTATTTAFAFAFAVALAFTCFFFFSSVSFSFLGCDGLSSSREAAACPPPIPAPGRRTLRESVCAPGWWWPSSCP
jgi:hypothetical protein